MLVVTPCLISVQLDFLNDVGPFVGPGCCHDWYILICIEWLDCVLNCLRFRRFVQCWTAGCMQAWTALMFACDKGHLEIAKALLAHGASTSETEVLEDYKKAKVWKKVTAALAYSIVCGSCQSLYSDGNTTACLPVLATQKCCLCRPGRLYFVLVLLVIARLSCFCWLWEPTATPWEVQM